MPQTRESFSPRESTDAELTALPTGPAEAQAGVAWKQLATRTRKSGQADEYLVKVKTFENMFTQQATVGNLRVMAVWLLKTRIQTLFRSKETFDCYKLNGTNRLDSTGLDYHTRINGSIASHRTRPRR